MQWAPLKCMCTCPSAKWRICSTGYVYDFSDTCQCIPVVALSGVSGMRGMAMFAALIVGGTLTIVSLVLYYRRQIRYFRHQLLRAESETLSLCSEGEVASETPLTTTEHDRMQAPSVFRRRSLSNNH